MGKGKSGESDQTGEYYGDLYYIPQGDPCWILLAETSDSSPWKLFDDDGNRWVDSGATPGTGGYITTPDSKLIVRKYIEIPISATFVEVKASLKEYDPTVFDADEDLGTVYLKLPVPITNEYQSIQQGNSSTGIVTWDVNLASEEYHQSLFADQDE
jgi:hypothetical protein